MISHNQNSELKGRHRHLVCQDATLDAMTPVSHHAFVQKLYPLDLMRPEFSREYGVYYYRNDVQLPVINQARYERSEHPMRISGSQKDELGIEFGLVLFCGNYHHHCILGIWVVPMTLKVSKRVTEINMKPTKVSFFPSSRGDLHRTTWEE